MLAVSPHSVPVMECTYITNVSLHDARYIYTAHAYNMVLSLSDIVTYLSAGLAWVVILGDQCTGVFLSLSKLYSFETVFSVYFVRIHISAPWYNIFYSTCLHR